MHYLKSLLLTLMFVSLITAHASADSINRPGQRVDISQFTTRGKATIFDFYSDYCGPCHSMAEVLDIVEMGDDSLVVKRINIDRPNSNGIDWSSPVAKQYGITSVPYLVIYDGDELFLQGDEARAFLEEYIQETYLDD